MIRFNGQPGLKLGAGESGWSHAPADSRRVSQWLPFHDRPSRFVTRNSNRFGLRPIVITCDGTLGARDGTPCRSVPSSVQLETRLWICSLCAWRKLVTSDLPFWTLVLAWLSPREPQLSRNGESQSSPHQRAGVPEHHGASVKIRLTIVDLGG